MGIFIKEITIKNYKCFHDESISFNIPDGKKEGSGLNILIGENGNGKTSILEAINYLTLSSYASENKLKINDFYDVKENIKVTANTTDFKCKMSFPYQGYFECNGISFSAKSRQQKSRGKLLSSPFQISNLVDTKTSNYFKTEGEDSGKEIPALNKILSNAKIDNDELNIFYFDKNRTRQITTGNYKTTFEKICEDLNWKFINNINEENQKVIIENICGDYFNLVVDLAQKGTGEKLGGELKDFFELEDYKNLKIELLELLHPFSNSFFALRNENELKQINVRELGSGIEIILTLLLLKSIAGESKGSIIYLIDEPELHLHPKAQEKLIQLLFKESKNLQVVISTHSPYIFKSCLIPDVGLKLLTRNSDKKIEIINAHEKDWGVLPWSPSWGEINFFAYDLPTIEFHNELYGYIQAKLNKYTIPDIEEHFVSKSILKSKSWIRISRTGEVQEPEKITLCSYIRNKIHHPENEENDNFTIDELRESIEILVELIKVNNGT